MAPSYIILFAIALLAELTNHSAMALPKVKMDDELTDQEGILSITDVDTSEMGAGQLTFRRHPILEGRLVDKDGTKLIFMLADKGIKGSPGREGNLAFSKTIPPLSPHGMDNALDGFNMRDESRSMDDVISVGRRDMDMLRCMIGRVYRPCWQV